MVPAWGRAPVPLSQHGQQRDRANRHRLGRCSAPLRVQAARKMERLAIVLLLQLGLAGLAQVRGTAHVGHVGPSRPPGLACSPLIGVAAPRYGAP